MKKFLALTFILINLLLACGKKDGTTTPPSVSITTPTVTTTEASNVGTTTAVTGGNVTADGGATVTARGICWGTTPAPTIAGNHSTDSSGKGVFTTNLTGLDHSTIYYARAYATNVKGTAYGNQISFVTPVPDPDLYILGLEDNEIRLWKNGVLVPNNYGGLRATAKGLAVSDKRDVYIAGKQDPITGNSRATVWKNGVPTFLTSGAFTAVANCIAISGNDVYVGGYEHNGVQYEGKIWKNGIPTSLTSPTVDGRIESICVSGNDVYAVGTENGIAKLWKNGAPTNLTFQQGAGGALGVTAINGTAYTCGFKNINPAGQRGHLWINGTDSSLVNGTLTLAMSIVHTGTDLYISCIKGKTGYIWKNGVLTNIDNSVNETVPYGLYVAGNNVYACGWEQLATGKRGLYWVNGKSSTLTSGNTECYTWAVVMK